MLESSLLATRSPIAKIVVPVVAAVALVGGGIGYAVHEHSAAKTLAAQNQTMTAQLSTTQAQVDTLTAKVNAMAAANEAKAAEPAPTNETTGRGITARRLAARQDARFNKLQTQLDAQGKQIDAQSLAIADARNDLSNTRTELTGSIARTHDELVVLEKRGERNYYEFDLRKSKGFSHEGPVGISLRKANDKRGYADLMLMVDDRNLQTKHVNLFQPSMFYEPDSPQPIEIVINDISKDHIHGYVSAPKYRKSELAAMANGNNLQTANKGNGDNGIVGDATQSDQAANAQPAPRKKLTLPSTDPNE